MTDPVRPADYVRPICRVTVVKGNHLTVRCGHPLPCPDHGGRHGKHLDDGMDHRYCDACRAALIDGGALANGADT